MDESLVEHAAWPVAMQQERRPLRRHVPGGLYAVTLKVRSWRWLFRTPADCEHLAGAIERARTLCKVKIHAYCWDETALHLAVQVETRPLGDFVRMVTVAHSKYLPRENPCDRVLFVSPYQADFVPLAHLPALVRRIHRTPLATQLTTALDDYPHSSHPGYLRRREVPWLTRETLWEQLGAISEDVALVYADLMSEQPPDELMAQGAGLTESPKPTLEHLLRQLAAALQKELTFDLDAVFSSSSVKPLPLVRYVLAEHVTRPQFGFTLTQVAGMFGCSVSSLSRGISANRISHRTLFTQSTLTLLHGAKVRELGHERRRRR